MEMVFGFVSKFWPQFIYGVLTLVILTLMIVYGKQSKEKETAVPKNNNKTQPKEGEYVSTD